MIVYGRNVAETILKREKLLEKVVKIKIEPQFFIKNKISVPNSVKDKLEIVSKQELDSLVSGLHQGIMLVMEDYHYTPLETVLNKDPSFLVVLDHLEDPHNLGAIIRTAVCAGADAIILPHDRQVGINATVMKTSAGTLYDIDIVEVVNITNTLKQLKKEDFWIVGTAMEGKDYRTFDYTMKTALIIGNEGKGISQLVAKNCDFIASIPMKHEVDSLNASVASAIMMYEVVRSRK